MNRDEGTRPVDRPSAWGVREAVLGLMTAWILLATLPAIADESPEPIAVPPSVVAEELRRIEVSANASRTAVAIFAGDAGGGSGVLVSADGYALTNFHVVQPAGVAMKCGLSDGRLYDAVLVGLDPTGDVALVKLLGRDDFPFAELADSDAVRVGDACFTAGNPFLLATNFQPSIAWGIVSGVHRYQFPAGTILEYTDCLQVDAAINPGNSGGGLFDGEGRLIGVNGRASFEKRGRVNVGVGYAISSNQILNFLGSLKGGRVVDHATLGATVATSFDGKVVVSDILESSDAYRRGLRYDDEIVAIADRPIRTVNAFKNVLGTLPAGWQVPLVVRREGRRMEFVVRLAGVHSAVELAKIAGEQPAEPPDADEDAPNDDRPKLATAKPRKPAELPEAVARHHAVSPQWRSGRSQGLGLFVRSGKSCFTRSSPRITITSHVAGLAEAAGGAEPVDAVRSALAAPVAALPSMPCVVADPFALVVSLSGRIARPTVPRLAASSSSAA